MNIDISLPISLLASKTIFQEEGTALAPGQILPATIVTTSDGKTNLALFGRAYKVSQDLPTTESTLWVQVQKVEPGTVTVKALLPFGQTVRDTEAAICDNLGLTANKKTLKVIKHLLRWRLPLSRELVQQFLSNADNIPSDDVESVFTALAFIRSLSLHKKPREAATALRYVLRHPKATPEGQEAINRSEPLNPDQQMIRALAFRAGQNEGEIYIVWRRQGGQRNKAQLPLANQLAIRLDTEKWGQVWIQLNTNSERTMSAKVLAENREFLDLAQAAKPYLRCRLKTIGWRLAELTVDIQKIGSVAELLDSPGLESYRSLDTLA